MINLKELNLFKFNCQVCFKFLDTVFADIGDQETADYSFSSASGACVLSLTGKTFPTGDPKRFILHFCYLSDSLYKST